MLIGLISNDNDGEQMFHFAHAVFFYLLCVEQMLNNDIDIFSIFPQRNEEPSR